METTETNILSKIKYEAILVGVSSWGDGSGTKCIKFVCRINGQDFDYHLGLGHLKQKYEVGTIKVSVPVRDAVKAIPSLRKSNFLSWDSNEVLYIGKPKLEEVLHCLLSDSMVKDISFKDWCSEMGYNEDSISHKKIYEACLEGYHKLVKALGRDYSEVETYIEKLEL